MSLYQHSQIEDRRLFSQNKILSSFTHDPLSQIITPNSIILDVGCASGDYIMMQLKNIPYAKLIGIDIDKEQIKAANEKYKNNNTEFICNDIMNGATIFNSKIFDVIILSSVLLHIDEPVKLLKKLKSLLKPDGYLFIQEEDDGANINYPNNEFYSLAYRIWNDSKESGDRYCARKVPNYLKDAGFTDIRLVNSGIANINLSDAELSDFWNIYFNHELWETNALSNIFNHKETLDLLDRYKALYEENKLMYDKKKVFIQLGFFIFVARK